MWTPGRKIHLMWTLRRNLSPDVDSLWSNEGPHFKSNKSHLVISWQGLLMLSVSREEPQTKVSASCTMPRLFMASESTPAGKPWFHLSTNELRPAPANQNCINCIFICIYTEQSELRGWACTILKTHLHETGNFGKNYFFYKGWPSLSLSGTQFKLLPESVYPSLQHLSLKYILFILYSIRLILFTARYGKRVWSSCPI